MALKRFTATHPVKGIRQQCIQSKIPGMMKFSDGTRVWKHKLTDLQVVNEN